MAEKEQRILVLKATEEDFIYKHFNGKGFIPRQEAIERMAKALIDIALTGHYSRFEDSCVVEDAISYAKAALNALLEKGE